MKSYAKDFFYVDINLVASQVELFEFVGGVYEVKGKDITLTSAENYFFMPKGQTIMSSIRGSSLYGEYNATT